jgi:hypothetical protein
LEWLLKKKERAKDEAMRIEDTQRLVSEIEMLKVVSCICGGQKKRLSMHEEYVSLSSFHLADTEALSALCYNMILVS